MIQMETLSMPVLLLKLKLKQQIVVKFSKDFIKTITKDKPKTKTDDII